MLKAKLKWTFVGFKSIFKSLFEDLWDYYITPYPWLLIKGAVRRFMRRFRAIWLPKPKGRPPIHERLVDLILDMKKGNWGWGAQRISDELRLLGIKVSKKTILKVLKMNGMLPPPTRFTPPSWRAFFHSYRRSWAFDFTTVFDVRGLTVFIFAMIDLGTRELVVIDATISPTREWLKQQFRNAAINGYFLPEEAIHDNDVLFSPWIAGYLEKFEIKSKPTTPGCPWENGFIERFHRSLKTEVIRRLELSDEFHVRKICRSYRDFYNQRRPHQGISGKVPSGSMEKNDHIVEFGKLHWERVAEVNGLVTKFKLVA